MKVSLFRLMRCVLVFLAVAGCSSGGSSSSSSGAPVAATPVQATVTPAGGTVQAASDDTTFKLTIPAGAVREDVTLTLTPVDPESGAWARLQVEPAGVQFFEPVTLTITTPQAQSGLLAGIYLGSAGNRLSVPTTVDAATGTLTATILVLAPGQLGQSKPIALGVDGEGEAGGNDFINVGEMNCANELSVLAARIEYAENFVFSANPSAYELIQQYKAMQAACANASASEAQQMAQETTQIKEKACTAQTNTLDAVNLVQVESEEDLYENVTRLLGSQASLDLTDAECGSPGAMAGGLTKAVSDYITDYEQRVNSPNFGGGTWLGLRGEVKSIVKLYDDAGMLLLDEHQPTIIDTLLKPALDKLHARAYQLCRQDNLAEGDQSYLADVMSGGQVFGIPIPFLAFDIYGKTLIPAGLADDIQYCASDLTVRAYDGTDLLEDQTLELGGGDTTGTHVTEGTIEVPVQDGVLSLEGIIKPLRCATPTTAATFEASTLVIKFNGVTVDELTHANGDFLPTNPVDLDVSDLYAAAGLDPNTPGTHVLTIVRQGTGCIGVYGDATVELFDITVVSAGQIDQPYVELAGQGRIVVTGMAGDPEFLCQNQSFHEETASLTITIVGQPTTLLPGQCFTPGSTLIVTGSAPLEGESFASLAFGFYVVGGPLNVEFTLTHTGNFSGVVFYDLLQILACSTAAFYSTSQPGSCTASGAPSAGTATLVPERIYLLTGTADNTHAGDTDGGQQFTLEMHFTQPPAP